MTSGEELSFAFLESHPADAARVMERIAPDAAAALLRSAPLRLVVPVLRQMLPIAGARCLEPLDDADAAGLLRGVGAQSGVALLRYLGAARRESLLRQLPTAAAIAYELLLGYPEGTVGAWMDPRTLALPADTTVAESLDRIRRADESLVGNVFVIDRQQRLLGHVEIADLLRSDPAAPLARLSRPSAHRLPAQALLEGLSVHPGWHEAAILPVVERGDRLVGAVTHATLLRTLSLARQAPEQHRAQDTLVGVAGAYWYGVSSLIQAMVGLLPVQRQEEKP